MRTIHPELIPYLRRADPTARDYLEAYVTGRNTDGTPRAHIRQRKDQWAEADGGAAAVDADFTRFDTGDLRLKDTITTLITSDTGTAEITDLERTSPFFSALIEWAETMPADREITRVKCFLNPRRDTSQTREVAKWRLELYRLHDGLHHWSALAVDQDKDTGVWFSLQPIAAPVDVAVVGDTEGYVTFDYSQFSTRPRPKSFAPVKRHGTREESVRDFNCEPTQGDIHRDRHYTVAVVYALKADGSPAGNVAWDYDAAVFSVVSGGTTVRGRRWYPHRGWHGGRWQDSGSTIGVPRIAIESGTYTAETITFSSGNLFDLGGAPTQDVELVGLVALPPGTAVTLEVRNDADTAWVPYTHGDFEEADLGLTSGQSRKLRATLTPDASGALTPTLKQLGRREVVRIDLSRVAMIEGYEQAFDVERHTGEIPHPRMVALKDGPRELFNSKIEQLLAENYINDILIRWWVGDESLERSKWLHMDDFLVLDHEASGDAITVELVGLAALLKDLAPPFSPGVNYAPDGTQSIGSWTDLAGGTTNIHLGIDEAVADETDGIRSGTSPANQEYIFTLPTPSDIANRRLFLDVDYAKDASGGETIELKLRIYQTGTLVAEIIKADIGADRVQATMELTPAQVTQLTDLPNIRGAVVANVTGGAGARRARVYWARFRSGGRREVVTYTNQTLKAVWDDLVNNRLALPTNLRGPGVETTGDTVSKQITGLRKRTPGAKDVIAKTELESIAYLADRTVGSSEGRIKAFDLSNGQAIRAFFPARRIRPGTISPGHGRRIPEFFVPYRWDPSGQEFQDEVRAFHEASILKIGKVGLGPPKWLEEETAKWIDTDTLAETVARRTVDRLGTGTMLWPFESVDRYPELEMGDLVAVEIEAFVSRDPSVAREIKGIQWAIGPLQRVGQGHYFTVHPRGYADILSASTLASRRFPPPGPRTVVIAYGGFTAVDSTQPWVIANEVAGESYARPAAVHVTNPYTHVRHLTPADLPNQATITNFENRTYRGTVGGANPLVSVELRARPIAGGSGGRVAAWAGIGGVDAWEINSYTPALGTKIPHVVSWDLYHYDIFVQLTAHAGSVDNARFQWGRITWE